MLLIEDDGLGFAEGFDVTNLSKGGHFGLLGISERVALLGGRMRLQRRPQGGSLLQVEIPHPRVRSDADEAI
jgi:signal transduction histidine kinase